MVKTNTGALNMLKTLGRGIAVFLVLCQYENLQGRGISQNVQTYHILLITSKYSLLLVSETRKLYMFTHPELSFSNVASYPLDIVYLSFSVTIASTNV